MTKKGYGPPVSLNPASYTRSSQFQLSSFRSIAFCCA